MKQDVEQSSLEVVGVEGEVFYHPKAWNRRINTMKKYTILV